MTRPKIKTPGKVKGERRDKNEMQLIKYMRGIGAIVIQANKSMGFDLLVLFRGKSFIVEVKNPSENWKLTDNEKNLMSLCNITNNDYWILENEKDCNEMLGIN